MHFVAALDAVPQMRAVLGLFEGVCHSERPTGHARITGRPAAVLLHLGPGLGNGAGQSALNARRARVPMVVVVGDHATYHKKYDAPLESDIDALAGSVSGWVHRSTNTADVADDAAQAVRSSRAGAQIASLDPLPADVSWSDGAPAHRGRVTSTARDRRPDAGTRGRGGTALGRANRDSGRWRRNKAGGPGCGDVGLRKPRRCTASVRAHSRPRLERGAGVPAIDRLAYFGEAARWLSSRAPGTWCWSAPRSPVSFFGYPDKPSDLSNTYS